MGRVEPAAHADDGLRAADRLHALHEPRHLDVERLVAVLREPGRVVGDEREPVERAAQADVARGRVELEVHGAEASRGRAWRAVVVERALAQAILAQPVEVDVGDRAARAVGEALGLGEQRCRPRRSSSGRPTTGRSWTRPRPRRHTRRRRGSAGTATGRASLRSSARAIVIGLPLRFSSTVAPASAACDDGGIGTQTSSHTSAWTTSPGTSSASNSRSGPNGASRSPTRMSSPRLVVAGRVPAALVELAVGRQVRLRRDAEQLAAVDHDGAVVEAVAVAQRRADDEHREEIGGCLDQPRDRRLDGVEHGILHHEVVDRVAGQAQLGEDGDGDGLGVALARRRRAPLRRSRPDRRSRRGWCRPRRARSRAGRRSRTGGSCPQSGQARPHVWQVAGRTAASAVGCRG